MRYAVRMLTSTRDQLISDSYVTTIISIADPNNQHSLRPDYDVPTHMNIHIGLYTVYVIFIDPHSYSYNFEPCARRCVMCV